MNKTTYQLQHTGYRVFPDDSPVHAWKTVATFDSLTDARKNITECEDYYRVCIMRGDKVVSTVYPQGL